MENESGQNWVGQPVYRETGKEDDEQCLRPLPLAEQA
ncbi:hypothetical protein L195_g060582, partial [Trifolium pratense]